MLSCCVNISWLCCLTLLCDTEATLFFCIPLGIQPSGLGLGKTVRPSSRYGTGRVYGTAANAMASWRPSIESLTQPPASSRAWTHQPHTKCPRYSTFIDTYEHCESYILTKDLCNITFHLAKSYSWFFYENKLHRQQEETGQDTAVSMSLHLHCMI